MLAVADEVIRGDVHRAQIAALDFAATDIELEDVHVVHQGGELHPELYAIMRFSLEFFRGDAARGTVFGGALSTSQFIAVIVVFLTLAALPLIAKRPPEAA